MKSKEPSQLRQHTFLLAFNNEMESTEKIIYTKLIFFNSLPGSNYLYPERGKGRMIIGQITIGPKTIGQITIDQKNNWLKDNW
jgi:hypothetical protein